MDFPPSLGLDDDRLAVHATGAAPAWLWSADGARIWWVNPAGCAVFSAERPAALAARAFDDNAPARIAVETLAAILPPSGESRVERLRGFAGAERLRELTCTCSLFQSGDAIGLLIVAAEPVGPPLSLAERVQRLDLGGDTAAALADGTIVLATGDARRRLAGATNVAAIGASDLCASAVATGAARGETRIGPVAVRRLGSGADTVLLLRFDAADTAPVLRQPSAEDALAPPNTDQRRRYPLRFVWHMDAGGRFMLGSEEFAEIIGMRNAIALGRPWHEINSALRLDPAGQLARALATRETFSNIAISWPVDGSAERLEVAMAGLPVFDRNRGFLGYRGFGVCRDVDRIDSLRTMRRLALFAPAPLADPSEGPAEAAAATPEDGGHADPPPRNENVVRFPGATLAQTKPAEPKSLSPGEHSAFRELARQLTARLQTGETADTGAGAAATSDPMAAAMLDQAGEERPPDHAVLNRLPVGIVIYRLTELLFANRAFLAMAGYADQNALLSAGGVGAIFTEAGIGVLADSGEAGRDFAIATRSGDRVKVTGRLAAVDWDGEPAFAVVVTRLDSRASAVTSQRPAETTPRATPDASTAMDRSTALTRLCHDARTPLNSILGFCDMMLEERYGPLGNDRYRDYLADVRKAGTELMAMLTDAADLARIEAGTFALSPVTVSLNDVVNDCVLAMQPQVSEARAIVRMSLAPAAHKVVADVAAVRQIVTNLLGHALRNSRPGGQVIVSTGVSLDGEVVLRLRDNGSGLTEQAIAAALDGAGPQATTLPWSGNGQTLPLIKALAEANHARLKITGRPHDGTLFEVTFAAPPAAGDWISALR